jgi:hypothetical protein
MDLSFNNRKNPEIAGVEDSTDFAQSLMYRQPSEPNEISDDALNSPSSSSSSLRTDRELQSSMPPSSRIDNSNSSP